MKIDFERLEKLAANGASATAIIEALKDDYAREQMGMEAAVDDSPRARLFRQAKPALIALGIAKSRAGALIIQWLKITHDDDQLILATILKAQSLAIMDAPSWILATLNGKISDGKTANGYRSNSGTGPQKGADAIIAGMGRVASRFAGSQPAAGFEDGDSRRIVDVTPGSHPNR
ncbi:hypothetical protein [Bradyrhizobium sp.]